MELQKTRFMVAAAAMTFAGGANAALSVSDGDFESSPTPDFGGTAGQDVVGWFEGDAADFADWVFPGPFAGSGGIVTKAAAGSSSTGYIYQSLGTQGAADPDQIAIQFDSLDRFGNAGAFSTINISLFSSNGSFVAADGTDPDGAAGLTQIGSTYSSSTFGLNQTTGFYDLSGLADGTEVYLRIGLILGSNSEAFVDNVSVTAIPEPSSLALLGLGALAVGVRRRRG